MLQVRPHYKAFCLECKCCGSIVLMVDEDSLSVDEDSFLV